MKFANATIYPLEVQFSKNIGFQKHTPLSSEMLDLLRVWHLKDIDEKKHEYIYPGALQVTILRKVSRCLAITFTWQNEPSCMCLSQTVCISPRQSVFITGSLCLSQIVCVCNRKFFFFCLFVSLSNTLLDNFWFYLIKGIFIQICLGHFTLFWYIFMTYIHHSYKNFL